MAAILTGMPAVPTADTRLEAPESGGSRREGAGTVGLAVADLDRTSRLKAMHTGELGSVHSWELVTAVDGPGTRMTVFLSGCPLQCLYCHNPDTLQMRGGEPVLAEEVLQRVRRYRGIFRATRGGITLSGGESLMQPAFTARILRGAREMGVHTCLDTSGYLGANATDRMLDDTDLVLLDVKSGDPDTYRTVTGRELEPTLVFGRRIAERGLTGHAPEMWIRFVLVPGYTDDPANVDLVADYVRSLNDIRPDAVTRVEVLPFHQMGRDKWSATGRAYQLADVLPPEPSLLERVQEQFRERGLTVY